MTVEDALETPFLAIGTHARSIDGAPVAISAGFAIEMFYDGDHREWFILGSVSSGSLEPGLEGIQDDVLVRTHDGPEFRGPARIVTGHPTRDETSIEVHFAGEPV